MQLRKEKEKAQMRLSQFQWYQIQTKVRQTVYELMQPFQKRQIEQFSKLHQMRKTLAEQGDKLKQYSFLLGSTQDDSPPIYFKEIENSIGQIKSAVRKLQFENKQSIGNFQIKLQFFEEKSDKFNDLMTAFQQIRRQRIQDKQQVTQLLSKQILSLTQTVTNHEMQTATIISSIKSRQFQVDQQILQMQNKLRHYDTTIRNSNSSLDILKRQLKAMTDRQFQDNKFSQGVDARLRLLQTDKQLSKKFMGVVDQINNRFTFVTSYIDKYLPLFFQAQLSDTLNSFITDKQRRALCVYQQKAFQNFNKIIIENQDDGLANNIRRYVGVVEQIILRNRKYVIRLKVQRKAKVGNRQYEVHVLDQDINQQKRITSDSQAPQINIKNALKQQWQQFSTTLQSNFKKNYQNMRAQIDESQSILQMKYLKSIEKIEKIQQRIDKNDMNLELQKKYVEQRFDDVNKKIEEIKKQICCQRDVIKHLINFSSILNHVVMQDEIDRQGIALFGLRETVKGASQKNDPTLTLDNKCLGCSGYPATTFSAFKMACLAYNPSSINVDGQLFKREQVFDLSTQLLEITKNIFENKQKQYNQVIISPRKLSNNDTSKQTRLKQSALHIFNNMQFQSKQALPAIKSKRSNQSSSRKKSLHQSFLPSYQDF